MRFVKFAKHTSITKRNKNGPSSNITNTLQCDVELWRNVCPGCISPPFKLARTAGDNLRFHTTWPLARFANQLKLEAVQKICCQVYNKISYDKVIYCLVSVEENSSQSQRPEMFFYPLKKIS